MSARRRPKLIRSVDSVMTYVEAEMAKLLARDPSVEAARQRAMRRANRTTRRSGSQELSPTH